MNSSFKNVAHITSKASNTKLNSIYRVGAYD